MAQSGHPRCRERCPLLGVKRTSRFRSFMSAYDPKRTSSRRSYVPWLKSVELFGTRGLVKGRDTIDGDGRHMPPIVRGPEPKCHPARTSLAREACGLARPRSVTGNPVIRPHLQNERFLTGQVLCVRLERERVDLRFNCGFNRRMT